MEILIVILIILLIVVSIFIREIKAESKANERLKKDITESWGNKKEREITEEDLKRISHFARNNKTETYIDELTWNDLDMDLVYENMAYTRSSAGDEYLYYMLRNPVTDKFVLDKREGKICSFTDKKISVELQLCLTKMGRLKKTSLLSQFEFLISKEEESNIQHYILNGILLISFGIMYIHLGVGLFLLFSMILYQMTVYFKIKAKMDSYLSSIRYLFSLIHFGTELLNKLPEEWKIEKSELSEILTCLGQLEKKSFLLLSPGRMSGQGFELILDYIRMIFHLDIIQFNRILGKVKENRDKIKLLHHYIGEIDACLAIAEYRETLPFWTVPEISDIKEIHIKQGYHPLIKKPVANDLSATRCILLTGSNASGKSTFLKMIGINILTAQSVHTCYAKELTLPICRLLTSLSLKDSILHAESYYMAEIKAIKRIIDAVKKNENVVSMVDEVLRGTNTAERIAASTEILKFIAESNVLMFAATHDRELTNTLSEKYDNFHFEEIIGKEDVEFSYLIKPGRAETSNAIRLLEYTGYDSEIVQKARKRLEYFEAKGEWM